jgi:hypothetical protein
LANKVVFITSGTTFSKEMPKTDTRPAASPELKQKYAPNTNGQRTDHRRGLERDEIPF